MHGRPQRQRGLPRGLRHPHTPRPGRVCLRDTEIGGTFIRAGEGVICNLPAANRDPAVFDHPETLDISREQRRHIGFGFGVHQCLGQNPSRVEMQVAWPILFERLPESRLAADETDLHFHNNALTYGLDFTTPSGNLGKSMVSITSTTPSPSKVRKSLRLSCPVCVVTSVLL
ncbi:cytochrome P450 [Nocardia nova]|uniref:cytochrome P450 n=1 Tax=Nocardia nova TaxID=37330 RepID=UPI00215879B2|nr:cytochrome P450 [Nocardia nova]